MRRQILATIMLAALLGGCGGRNANPVSTVSVTDRDMTCNELQNSISGNEGRISALFAEEQRAKTNNVAIGVVGGLLFWPARFALDTRNTEQVEINALRSRNVHLTSMASERRCASGGVPLGSGADPVPGPAGRRAPADDTYVRCGLADGSVTVVTPRECAVVGGRT